MTSPFVQIAQQDSAVMVVTVEANKTIKFANSNPLCPATCKNEFDNFLHKKTDFKIDVKSADFLKKNYPRNSEIQNHTKDVKHASKENTFNPTKLFSLF